MKLFAHQQKLVNEVPSKHLLAWQGGTGKTATAIRLAEKIGKTVLVLCPKSVVENWEREISKWKENKKCGWLVMSKEQFKKKNNMLCGQDTIILDEAHYWSNYKSQLHKETHKFIEGRKIENVLLLTGTPYLSSAWNIYSLARLLGRDWGWLKFKRYFFYDVKMGRRMVPVAKKGMEKEIAGLVNKLGSTVKLDDCVDMPPEVDKYEYFTPNKEQLKAISQITDLLPIVRYAKIHQILNGTLKGDGYVEDRKYPCDKIDRVIEIIAEHKKICVVCSKLLEINEIHSRIEKGKQCFILRGDTENRQEIIDQIEKSTDCVVIISIGVSEGYNLPSIQTMILYSLSYKYKDYEQIRWRIRRIDHPQKCVYINMIYKNTIDEAVFKNILSKQNFQVEIYKDKI